MIGPTQDDAQVELLQRDVDRVVDCFAGLGLKINAKKSQHLLISISPTGPRDTKPLIVDGVTIKKVESLKYLGLHLDGRLSLKTHVEKVVKRARDNCRQAIEKIYTTCIRPIMTYAIAVYYPSTADQQRRLARVDRTAAQSITNKYGKETGDELIEHLQWHTIAQLASAERVSQFWQYAKCIRRTPGGSHVIQEIDPLAAIHSARQRARQEQSTPDHTQYQVVGVPAYDPSRQFNTPLALAAHLYNITPDIVFNGASTAKRIKARYLANERGQLIL